MLREGLCLNIPNKLIKEIVRAVYLKHIAEIQKQCATAAVGLSPDGCRTIPADLPLATAALSVQNLTWLQGFWVLLGFQV